MSFRIHLPWVLNASTHLYCPVSTVQRLHFLSGAVNVGRADLGRDRAPNRPGDISNGAEFLSQPSLVVVHDVAVPAPAPLSQTAGGAPRRLAIFSLSTLCVIDAIFFSWPVVKNQFALL
jgi:hypothetical protein